MNEIEKKQLKGIDGWLIMVQIYIIYGVTNYGTALVVLPLLSAFSRRLYGELGAYDIFGTAFIPYFIGMIAISFVLLIVCMVLFYKRKMAFRVLFAAESAVMILGMILFYIFGLNSMFSLLGAENWVLMTAMRIIFAASMLVGIAPNVALIIALYKSKRVKNTFN